MATYYVETYRPAYPARGVKVRVHSAREYGTDVLNPGMTAVFEVSKISSKPEALALVAEYAAGKPVCVSRVF